MPKRPELMITNGPLQGKRFAVKEGGLRLGRSSSNDIHIPDEELSRNHCLFETVGSDGVRVTDLASANGTYLNGKALGSDPVTLQYGDLIEVGTTVIKVVGDEPPPAPKPDKVDLGLGKPSAAPGGGAGSRKRSPLANLLWLGAVALAGVAAYLVLTAPPKESAQPQALPDEDPPLKELYYEKVEADSKGIFRYELTLSRDGVLKVSVDNVPAENRHVVKSQQLDEKAQAELGNILAFSALREIDREYVGVEPDPPALESWTLRTIYASRAKMIRVVNTQEPAAFRAIREKLEAFSKNQLGVWALQYSREKLISLAEEAIAVARTKWEDRDVNHGNLFGAVTAYGEALFYLETVNPQPPCAETAREGLRTAKAELETRYADQRFLADRAINLSQWETAQRELTVLVEMIPDRNDDRNREATAKLLDVEKRMKGAQ